MPISDEDLRLMEAMDWWRHRIDDRIDSISIFRGREEARAEPGAFRGYISTLDFLKRTNDIVHEIYRRFPSYALDLSPITDLAYYFVAWEMIEHDDTWFLPTDEHIDDTAARATYVMQRVCGHITGNSSLGRITFRDRTWTIEFDGQRATFAEEGEERLAYLFAQVLAGAMGRAVPFSRVKAVHGEVMLGASSTRLKKLLLRKIPGFPIESCGVAGYRLIL